MRYFLRVLGMLVLSQLALSSAARAQPAVTEAARQAAQSAAGPATLHDVVARSPDTLLVVFETSSLMLDLLLREPWWPRQGTPRRTKEQAGREIAKAIRDGVVPVDRPVAVILVHVRSYDPGDDPTRLRLSYKVSELGGS